MTQYGWHSITGECGWTINNRLGPKWNSWLLTAPVGFHLQSEWPGKSLLGQDLHLGRGHQSEVCHLRDFWEGETLWLKRKWPAQPKLRCFSSPNPLMNSPWWLTPPLNSSFTSCRLGSQTVQSQHDSHQDTSRYSRIIILLKIPRCSPSCYPLSSLYLANWVLWGWDTTKPSSPNRSIPLSSDGQDLRLAPLNSASEQFRALGPHCLATKRLISLGRYDPK